MAKPILQYKVNTVVNPLTQEKADVDGSRSRRFS